MTLLRVTMNAGRPGGRVYVCGHRWHHGMAGLMAAGVGVSVGGFVGGVAVTLGALAMAHDWRDFPWASDREALFA